MSKIKATIWPMEPHTEAKLAILRKYLDAWFPIITSRSGRALYIDGFAGPGEYVGGKDGSPIVAIKAAVEHKTKISSEIVYLFIEADKSRYEYLNDKLKSLHLPSNIKCHCFNGRFADVIDELFTYLDDQKSKIAPSFVFIDPFGFTGIPFHLIKRIMENDKCEVMITFMYEEINRFIGEKKLWGSLNETFGTDKWQDVVQIKDSQERLRMLHGIYQSQLEHEAGIKHVSSFKMINKSNKTDYFLFFGTNNILGLKKMKEAMWKVDEAGLFQFSDATYNPLQTTLFSLRPDYSQLKKIIISNFKDKSVSVEELENYIITQTPFRETHYKRQILAEMEKSDPPELIAKCPHRKRKKGTFPADCIVEFI